MRLMPDGFSLAPEPQIKHGRRVNPEPATDGWPGSRQNGSAARPQGGSSPAWRERFSGHFLRISAATSGGQGPGARFIGPMSYADEANSLSRLGDGPLNFF